MFRKPLCSASALLEERSACRSLVRPVYHPRGNVYSGACRLGVQMPLIFSVFIIALDLLRPAGIQLLCARFW